MATAKKKKKKGGKETQSKTKSLHIPFNSFFLMIMQLTWSFVLWWSLASGMKWSVWCLHWWWCACIEALIQTLVQAFIHGRVTPCCLTGLTLPSHGGSVGWSIQLHQAADFRVKGQVRHGWCKFSTRTWSPGFKKLTQKKMRRLVVTDLSVVLA